MELFIVTPGIKYLSPVMVKRLASAKLVFLTNPLCQNRFRSYAATNALFLVDDDFICDNELEDLVEAAKILGWNWFLLEGFEGSFKYKNIDLRSLFTQDLVLYLVKALKIIFLYTACLLYTSDAADE